MSKQSSKKSQAIEPAKIEVENVRLSQATKDNIISKYVREKFEKARESIKLALSKEIEKEHEVAFPELKKLSDAEKRKWLLFTGRATIKGIDFALIRKRSRDGSFDCANSFPIPTNMDQYYGFVINKPSEKILDLCEKIRASLAEEEKFRDSFSSLMRSVNTSKQLCELVPELAPMFPKRVNVGGTNASTALVPIDLINSVRSVLQSEPVK